MVRFSVECVLPISQDVFWQVRDTYTFMRFLMTDGILKHISAGAQQVDTDGWATRRSEYCPVNVDCPEFVRRVVGDTMFELSDEQKWNDSIRPYHLTFIIRPSFLTKLSNTRGELEVRPFPPDKQPQLPQITPSSPLTENDSPPPESNVSCEQTDEKPAQETSPNQAESSINSQPEANPGSDSQLVPANESLDQQEKKRGNDSECEQESDCQSKRECEPVSEASADGESSPTTEPLLESSEPTTVVDVIDDGVVSPCSEFTSFEDLDELLDDNPHLPDVVSKPTPPETSSAQHTQPSTLDDFASEIDSSSGTDTGEGSTDNVDGDCEDVAQRDAQSDEDVTDGDDNNNRDSSEPDGTDENHDTQDAADSRASNIVNDCIIDNDRACDEESSEDKGIDADAFRLDWIDEGASQDKDLDITAEIDRLPVEEKCLLEVSGRTSVRIITIGWFVERTIVHNLRQFYGDYPATLLRFRRMLYRRFANADHSVPISVVIERLLQWERTNKEYLESELTQFCNERSNNSSRDKNNNRPQKDTVDTNSTPSENAKEDTSIAANPNTDPQIEKPGPVPVSA